MESFIQWHWVVLILLGFILGWLLAKRRNKKTRRQLRFSSDYFQGLNYLLNDEQDKAIEVFLQLVESDWQTIDTHLTLGSIFRRKGEIDKAIKLHQSLLARPSLPSEYKVRVLLELGRDYQLAGWLDRAEGLFNEVLKDSDYTEEALTHLMDIYQQEHEWEEAITVAKRYQRAAKNNLKTVIAQFYCELSDQEYSKGDLKESEALAVQGLSMDENCVRASIILGKLAIQRGRYKKAIRFFKQVEFQDVVYLPLVVIHLIECYKNQSNLRSLISYLRSLDEKYDCVSLTPVIVDLINEVYDTSSAIEYLSVQMKLKPSLDGIQKMLEINLSSIDVQENYIKEVIDQLMLDQSGYQCSKCGYTAKTLYWLCPSCHTWSGMKPRHQ
ncbi:MAG: lipopolysaccharide assembly protein LapB [Gammaproteobacteria bacterium]|nr:lipopolysaccharide assembly protein LapB [Gammaproteobacteria bacterium]MCW8909541.1 lipopolysaccharide assembly protein LapB [Gammaproteobacteria bacterium]MCW9003967.1 lipopolysaccharide assembly protein LapB [Gammaproteobacteria bacterium]MCW9055675.1 lipopolysaccharide assembly protein LapB [Gammaproteobacteria bacterium]